MKAVAEAAWLQAPAPQSPRTITRDRQNDFSKYVNRADQQSSARAADTSASDVNQPDADTAAAEAARQDQATEESSKKEETANAQDENLAWLAAQMLAYKLKLPMQQGSGEGSSDTPQTAVVTLPASLAAAGLAPPAPGEASTLDESALRALMAGQVPETPAAQPLPTTPEVAALPVGTDSSAVDPSLSDPAVTTPISADPAVLPPVVTDPAVTPVQDPTTPVVAEAPPTDPDVIVAETDPALTPAPVEADPIVAEADQPPVDDAGAAPAGGSGNGATVSAGRAAAVSASSNSSSSGFAGNGADGQSNPDPQTSEKTAGVNLMTSQSAVAASLSAPVQSQLAVPNANQLAPTLGIEIASTVQGMSALDRMLQVTDQAQSVTPMLKTLNVQLAPPDLGNVSVHLSLEGNALEVRMSADQGRTRTLLERDRHLIADSLTKVGYSVSTLTVDQPSSASNSDMSSSGQSNTSSNNSFDGSSGRQSNGAGGSGRSPNDSGRWANFVDGEGSAAAPAARPATRGVFI